MTERLQNFNSAIDDILLHDRASQTLHPRICAVCDKFVSPNEQCNIELRTFLQYAHYLAAPLDLNNDLKTYYRFTIPGNDSANRILHKALLSPKTQLISKQPVSKPSISKLFDSKPSESKRSGSKCSGSKSSGSKRSGSKPLASKGSVSKPSASKRSCSKHCASKHSASKRSVSKCSVSSHSCIICCKDCKQSLSLPKLKQGILPRFAIANNLTIGHAPPCIEKLNDIELALLSQARLRGHLFTYWGGCHRSIKGWHCFYDVNPSHTTAVLNDVSHFTNSKNIAVVLYGPFTKEQRQKILHKVEINTEHVIEAFNWLKVNNILYSDMQLPDLALPTIIDKSHEIDSKNSDIEMKEEIQVVFPDCTIHTGGCTDRNEFDKTIAEIRSKCGDTIPFLTSRPSSKILRDYKDMNLMRAFPKQFPYGYGFHDDFNIRCSFNGYLKHLLSLSQPAFHEADFVLVIHNMFEKSRALSSAFWQVQGKQVDFNFTPENLNTAIAHHLNGLPPTHGPAQQFLNSIKSVKRHMAHTNLSAQAAQSKFLSLTHHFGCPKVLFTVSFDDSLDIRILTLSGKQHVLDWITKLKSPSCIDELDEQMQELHSIRYKYPGICALNFEYLLHVVLDKIVGDNPLRSGLFGTLQAYAVAVEEQGRKTLHAHILVFILGWNELLQRLQSKVPYVQKQAEREIIQFVDSILSTELTPGTPNDLLCSQCKNQKLTFASQQHLRNLRHKVGCKRNHGIIAQCSSCGTTFSGNSIALQKTFPHQTFHNLTDGQLLSLVSSYVLQSTTPTAPVSNSPTTRTATAPVSNTPTAINNYRFNHHLDQHTKTCFKKGDEARCRLPDFHEPRTHVLRSDKPHQIFSWCGSSIPYHNITIRPRRFAHDAFTNTYCKIMSACKAPCNSNVGITTGARSTIYASCYAAKATQKEDSQEYIRMATYVANRLLHDQKETTLFQGLSMLLGSVMVGTSEHVCSGPMAAYLVRNQSRFIFSVNFKYIPIRELISLVQPQTDNHTITLQILDHNSGCFLTNEALHYLLRPLTLENFCAVDFFVEYEVIRKHSNEIDADYYEFDNAEHPGFHKQIIRARNPSNPVLPQFSHWTFPDTAFFGGDLFNLPSNKTNSHVENFCQAVLVLYHPFRSSADLTLDGSYHKKFLQLFPHQDMVPSQIATILQNIQMFYNSMRLPAIEDPLLHSTSPFSETMHTPHADDNSSDTSSDSCFDSILDLASLHYNEFPDTDSNHITLLNLRKAGARHCGFDNLPLMNEQSFNLPSVSNISTNTTSIPFISTLHTVSDPPTHTTTSSTQSPKRDRPSFSQLMTLTYQSTRRRVDGIMQSPSHSVEATGTAKSIIEWSMQIHLNFDVHQMTAFQIITAAFVLTYYDDYVDSSDETKQHSMRHDFNTEKKLLQELACLSLAKPYLRMFLDGAAGAGKTHIIKATTNYASNYASNLGVTFDMRTIILTALSGVAAVGLGGETIHSAAAWNRNIDPERDHSWINARLLIIDECSFMNTSQVELLDEKLRCLLHRPNVLFGGIHVVFSGDFRQLEPVNGKPLYSPCHSDKKWINSITCYIELQGLHRFKDDPLWGETLQRLRNAKHTKHDIDTINKCVISNRNIPSNASYCVYSNSDRSAINAGIFNNLLDSKPSSPPSSYILIVKASNIQQISKDGSKLTLGTHDLKFLYEHCGDHRVSVKHRGKKGHFVDLLLKLYHHAPLMFVSNDDVPNGHANGTRVLLEHILLQPDTSTDTIIVDGHECLSVHADSIASIVCSSELNPSKLFHVHPKTFTCLIKAPLPSILSTSNSSSLTVNYTASFTQLPVLLNNATTGHKLQGQTKSNLVIAVWSKKRNWNYVALSRVTTRKGLFLVSPLPQDVDFSISPDLQAMLQSLKTLAPPPCTIRTLLPAPQSLHSSFTEPILLPTLPSSPCPSPPDLSSHPLHSSQSISFPSPDSSPSSYPQPILLSPRPPIPLHPPHSILFPPLTPADITMWENALSSHDNTIVASCGTPPISVTRASLTTLIEGHWLDDCIINAFLSLLNMRESTLPHSPCSYCFNTFLWTWLLPSNPLCPTELAPYNYSNVRTWSSHAPSHSLHCLDKIFFPLHIRQSHWASCIAYPNLATVFFLDSLPSPHTPETLYLECLVHYLQDEHFKVHGFFHHRSWNMVPCCHSTTPLQQNCNDCGVFMCLFAERLLSNKPLTFNPDIAPLARLHIALALLKNLPPSW
jgi:PIF1-like helicase/Ulp1 protease family, C-terminal catalytic domain/Helitron helicase-like domain at N-terminus